MRLRVTRVDRSLPLPDYASEGAAGFDLTCRADTEVAPSGLALIPSNIIARVPPDHVLLVTLRSSTPRKTGLICPHGIGVIDPDYCGPEDEIKIQVYNPGERAVVVRRGDRIAQAFLISSPRVEFDEGPAALSSRGGFGSTG